MNIQRNNKNKRIFSEIDCGEVFEYNGEIYMKCDDITVSQDKKYKVVSLRTGTVYCFGQTDANIELYPDATIILEKDGNK